MEGALGGLPQRETARLVEGVVVRVTLAGVRTRNPKPETMALHI